MSNTREILNKIKTISNTQKITKAMEMVAASKMRRSQIMMEKSRPYSDKMLQVISHLAKSHSEYRHPYFDKRDIKNIGFLIISSDRGLCGGLNNNLFKQILFEIQKCQEQGFGVELFLVGKKAEAYFRRFDLDIQGLQHGLSNKVDSARITGITKLMLDRYTKGKIDSIKVVYNKFVNTMSQEPIIRRLIPLESAQEETYDYYWDYIYEPEARGLLDELLNRYIESIVYQAVVENVACEQSARMIAMKSATDNAGELIKKFRLSYNKARQASITQEISEIVGGASAV
ncbi:MAG: F0F1 ATP synthase subunit gamma [Legionellales bacterium]|nr:F0F1 ATP synthase subunit gamma [Legionellales bacterium]